MTDLRHTLRSLARNPGFTAVAVLTLALGIGANVAVFSVADAVLFRPLEYRDADRLVELVRVQGRGTPRQVKFHGMTRSDVETWQQQTQVFDAVEASTTRSAVIDSDDPQREEAGQISAGMLAFLGVSPILGRPFRPEESVAGADGVVVIGENVWKTRFAGDPAVLGKTLSIDRRPHTIIGVLPASFRFPVADVRIWLPLPAVRTPGKPGTSFITPLARLNPGLSLDEAQRRINAATTQLEKERPSSEGWAIELMKLDRDRADQSTRSMLLVLLGAVGFVLLIASANVANLFLARNISRQREVAVRAAIGASWMRLMRQFLVEGLVVAALGGVVALLAASWALDGLGWISASILQWPTVFDPELNRRVLTFMIAVTGLAALGCALVPAFNVARRDLYPSFLGGSRVVGLNPRHHRISQALASIEVAVTFVLLLGAGLLANSFIRLVSVDPGFDTRDLLTIDFELPADRYPSSASRAAATQQMLDGVRALPGVREAIVTGAVPPESMFSGTLIVEGDPAPPARGFYTNSLNHVAPEHFRFLSIPLVEGRAFDRADSSGPPVAIVDDETVARFWPNGRAIGRRIQASPTDAWRTIVGVVGRVRLANDVERHPQVYVPLMGNYVGWPVIRLSGDADTVIPLIRERIRGLDREIRISGISTVEDNYGEWFARPRVFLMLMAVFAAVALALAVVGLYGVLAYFVNQRTQEIGVRIALGARSSEVRRMVVREAMLPVGAGLALGLAASFWLNTFLSTLLFGVAPHDATTIAGVALLLLMVSFAAAFLPASRAAKVDPVVALRAE